MRKVGIATIYSVIWAEISQQGYKSIVLNNIFRDIPLNTKLTETIGTAKVSQYHRRAVRTNTPKTVKCICFSASLQSGTGIILVFIHEFLISFQKTLFELVIYMIPGELLLKWASYSSLA